MDLADSPHLVEMQLESHVARPYLAPNEGGFMTANGVSSKGIKKDSSTNKNSKRFHTRPDARSVVWVHAAGHCELCGTDLTQDFRVGTPMNWGEVAHILPASPKGPRADEAHDTVQAEALTNDPDNLLLACPNCHEKIDRDAEGYPLEDLNGLHQMFLQRVRLAAKTPSTGSALALIFLSQSHETRNSIPNGDLLAAMSQEGLHAIDHPVREVLPEPGSDGRDARYWQTVTDRIQHSLQTQLRRASNVHGDIPALAVAGLADIPALMMLGQVIGDRSKRYLYSPNRSHGLGWPDEESDPPEFVFRTLVEGNGHQVLVLSLSAVVPTRDIQIALPDARINEFTVSEPSYSLVKNRRVIGAFSEALQLHLSVLEARSPDPVHVFAAVPAVLAIEFGALLTTHHRHPYIVYDRDGNNEFVPALSLPPFSSEPSK